MIYADEEYRAALWRAEQRMLLLGKLQMLRVLAAPPEPYKRVRESWRPVELAIAESHAPTLSPYELLEEESGRRNPFGCLIP